MSVKEIVFSPTGGTKAVADIVAHALAPDVFFVDLTDRFADHEAIALSEEDVAVIAMPCYGGRVPALAASRFACIQGSGARAIIVAVYGNRAFDDQLVEMEDLAEAAGFRVVAGISAVAEHSIARQFAAGRPDAADVAVLEDFAKAIAEKLAKGEDHCPELPGNRPYKALSKGGHVPVADSTCVHCGQCAEKCPNGAIDSEHLETADAARCISCMRCVAVCPVGARSIGKETLAGTAAFLEKAGAGVRHEAALYL